jgi:hypothetical protein
MSSLKINKKEIYEDYQGPFHILVPNRQLTPNTLNQRTPTSHKFYRMPVVRKKVSEELKYLDVDKAEANANSLSSPTEVY